MPRLRRPPREPSPPPPQQQQQPQPQPPAGGTARAVDPTQLQTPPQRVMSATTPPQLNPFPTGAMMMDPRRAPARAAAAAGVPRFNPAAGSRATMDTDSDTHEEEEEEEEEENEEEEEAEEEAGAEEEEEAEGEEEGEEGEEEEVEDEDEEMRDRNKSPSPIPPNLREISSLASWTVSTHKPGCGVAALRNPSTSQYWQSDGPQPHILTLHFFKLVAVVKIRVYLDFELDESYTPTKMVFLAGMGEHDLVEFAMWEGEAPCGWVDIPLEGVGGRNGGWGDAGTRSRRRRQRRKSSRRKSSKTHDYVFSESEDEEYGVNDDDDHEGEEDEDEEDDDDDDPYAGNVLKAMVIQMRVLENHQNGKDTHVRGFQVFAVDDDRRRASAVAGAAGTRSRRQSVRKSLRGGKDARDEHAESGDGAAGGKVTGLEEPDWMGEPVIR